MSKLPNEIRWHLAERRAERAYESHPDKGLSCGPRKVNMAGDRFWAHKGAFVFHFGTYGTHVLAYGRLEDALEDAAAWLKDNTPGMFTEPAYAVAMKECADAGDLEGLDEDEQEECVRERAESDLTYTESGWLVSYEWTITELHSPEELLAFVQNA
jgi:hypothetical protein